MMRPTVGGIAPAARPLTTPPITAEVLTEAEFFAAIAERERAPHDDVALTRACIEALRLRGEPLPCVPLRVVRGWSPNGTSFPKTWGVLIERDETPVAFAPLPAPFVGFVAVVARVSDLRRPVLTHDAKRRIASALADAILAEVESR